MTTRPRPRPPMPSWLDAHAVTPAEKLALLRNREAYLQAVVHGGKYYPVRGTIARPVRAKTWIAT